MKATALMAATALALIAAPLTRETPSPDGSRSGTPPPSQGVRAATFTGGTYDPATREADVVLSTGIRVNRHYFAEELEISAEAIDLGRVAQNQVRLLFNHDADDPIGAVISARIEAGQLVGRVRFNDTPRGLEFAGMVERGELTGISVGYNVRVWRIVEVDEAGRDVWRASSWELMEASLAPVPADPHAGVRSAVVSPGSETQEDPNDMLTRTAPTADPVIAATVAATLEALAQRSAPAAPAAAPAAPAAPVADANSVRFDTAAALDFSVQARSFGATDEQVRTWSTTLTPDAARAALLTHAAEQQRQAAPIVPAMSGGRVGVDDRDHQRAGLISALTIRANPDAEASQSADDLGRARRFRGMSLIEMGRAGLAANGERVEGLSRREVADLMLSRNSTTDFPYVFGTAVNRTLRDAYEAAPRTFQTWARETSMPDFRQVARVQIGGVSKFVKVPEGGAFQRGTFGDGREAYALATYGRIIPITRQVLINDDLDFLSRLPLLLANAAADFENDTIYSILLDNPNMGDGAALFSAGAKNLAAAGSLVDESNVEKGELAMMAQTGIAPKEGEAAALAPSAPKFLLVGGTNKNAAIKLNTATTAAKASDVNPYAGALTPVIEPRLGKNWFLVADHNRIDTVEFAYLEGDRGLYTEERLGYEVDGMEIKGRLDFAGKAIDRRGLYKNAG